MVEKLFVSAQQFHRDSLTLAKKVKESGFRPQFIVALWRGGTFPGCVVQEYLEYFGIPNDHIAIRTSSRNPDGTSKSEVAVHGLNYILENASATDSILLVDDIFDKGHTMEAVVSALRKKLTRNDIRVATVYYKPEANTTLLKPDYFVTAVEKDTWVDFPHELHGLTEAELKRKGVYEFF